MNSQHDAAITKTPKKLASLLLIHWTVQDLILLLPNLVLSLQISGCKKKTNSNNDGLLHFLKPDQDVMAKMLSSFIIFQHRSGTDRGLSSAEWTV